MKTKVNQTLLVSFFIVFLVSVFLVFAIIQNNALPVWAVLLLFITLLMGIFLFALAMYLFGQTKSKTSEIQQVEDHIEVNKQEISDTPADKIQEEEFDYKKIIPREKQKPELFSEELLRNLASELSVVQALFYLKSPTDEIFRCTGKFAYYSDSSPADFKSGETLPGQAVKNKSIVTLSNIPENYMIIASGLGKGIPGYLTFVPIISHDEVIGLIEFATFTPISASLTKNLGLLAEKIGDSISKFYKKQ